MGKHEEGKCSKSEKSSSPATADETNQINVHGHPDWAAMQAYYGPRVTLLPYYNPTVTSGSSPVYVGHTSAIYPHGGVYVHAIVPLWCGTLGRESRSRVDFGDEEYKQMLCVDSATIDKPVTLKPGEEWTEQV